MEIYIVFATLMWWVIDWVKRFLNEFGVQDKITKVTILILAIAGGIGLAIGYNLDLFVLLKIQETPSLIGKIFGGFGIASGSGGVYELLKSIREIGHKEEVVEKPAE